MKKIRFRIPGELDYLTLWIQFAQSSFDFWNLQDDFYSDIISASLEGVTNAIKHGCKKDNDYIDAEVELHDDKLIIKIQDYGSGFDLKSIPDPTEDDNILMASGRGIFIMRHLMDNVIFSFNNGTLLTLEKNR